MEIKAKDGVYKVYDYDRDHNPDVVMPDGRAVEMSQADLDKFLIDEDMTALPESSNVVEQPMANNEAKLTQFMNEKGLYQNGFYEIAKTQGKTNELFHTVLETKNEKNLFFFVDDYAQDHDFPTDKRDVFYHQLRNTDKIYEYRGPMDHLAKSFDESVFHSFKELKSHDADKWWPIRLGDHGQYALAQKFHTGTFPFRSDHYFVDTNGDGRNELIIENDKDLVASFKKGHFDIQEDSGPSAEPKPSPGARSPWEADKKILMTEEGGESKIEYVALKEETVPKTSPGALPQKELREDSGPKIVDSSDQVTAAESPSAPAELVKDMIMKKNVADIEPRVLAVESINRGDPGLHFDLAKIENGDRDYLMKVRENVNGMLVFLGNSSGGNVPKLSQGYSEILEFLDKKLSK